MWGKAFLIKLIFTEYNLPLSGTILSPFYVLIHLILINKATQQALMLSPFIEEKTGTANHVTCLILISVTGLIGDRDLSPGRLAPESISLAYYYSTLRPGLILSGSPNSVKGGSRTVLRGF